MTRPSAYASGLCASDMIHRAVVGVEEDVGDGGIAVLLSQLCDVRHVAARDAGGVVHLVHMLVALKDVDDAVRREEGLGVGVETY